MTISISVFIATSLDGFIARKNGDIDWLPAGDESGEDYGYGEFISSVDHLVMGRHTYEKVLTFGDWPFPDRRVIVLSSGAPRIPVELADKVTVLNGSPRELLTKFASLGAQRIYLDGGKTIQRFLAEGLVDEMTITTIPVLIGEGFPLFGLLQHDMKFILIESKHFKNGLVQCKYSAEKKEFFYEPCHS
jgi:dihydrofolate reductase